MLESLLGRYDGVLAMPNQINNLASFKYLQQFNTLMPDMQQLDISFMQTDIRDWTSKEDAKAYNDLIKLLTQIQKISDNQRYNHKFDYQKYYTKLHELAAKIVVKKGNLPESASPEVKNWLAFHDQFFIKLYENPAKFTEAIYEHLITSKEKPYTQGPEAPIEKSMNVHIRSKLKTYGIKKPGFLQFGHPENWANKLFSGLWGINYNPLKRTNIPYTVPKAENVNGPTIIRMGTQVKNSDTLQPSFRNYSRSKQRKFPDKKFHHVYFNLLKRDEGGFERNIEAKKSTALQALHEKQNGIAMITLPADNPDFFAGYDRKKGTEKTPGTRYQTNDMKNALIDSIKNSENDYHIPEDVKQEVFGDKLDETVEKLFYDAVHFVTGNRDTTEVNATQRQAILFEFVKYQLSNHIIQQIDPDSVNFSCKDGIDRGGVHTLWYDFRRRMEAGYPMSEKEFKTQLDSPALLVKGRPANEHRNLIWNVLKEAYMANPQPYENMGWVHDWLIHNRPPGVQKTQLQGELEMRRDLLQMQQDVIVKQPEVKPEEEVLPIEPINPPLLTGYPLKQSEGSLRKREDQPGEETEVTLETRKRSKSSPT